MDLRAAVAEKVCLDSIGLQWLVEIKVKLLEGVGNGLQLLSAHAGHEWD